MEAEESEVTLSAYDDIKSLIVRAQCWQGKLGQRPSSSRVVNLSVDASQSRDADGDVVVAGEIPHNPQVPSNRDRYSCIFGFQQRVGDNVDAPAPVTSLFYNGKQGRRETNGLSYEGFIVSGSNAQGTSPITTQYESINTQKDNPQQHLNNYIPSNNNAASKVTESTDNPTGKDPWTHFPQQQAGGRGSELKMRHPLAVYQSSKYN